MRDRAKRIDRRNGLLAAVIAIAVGLMLPAGVQAGGSMDDDAPDPDAGPSYYGFVKDSNGSLVPDAKVSAELKHSGMIVARTDLLGIYRIPGFGKEINTDDVTIACAKEGYKQTQVLRRPSSDAAAPVETNCTLQRE